MVPPDEKKAEEEKSDLSIAETLISEQNAIIESIKTFRVNYKKRSPDKRTYGYITGRIAGVENEWKQFTSNHVNILTNVTIKEKKLKYFTDNLFSSTEEFYSDFLGELYDARQAASSPNPKNTPPPNISTDDQELLLTKLKLPAVDIHKFSGSYRHWRSFYDLFSSMIHQNAQIAKVQKLYFLKTHLEGEAARLVRHLDIVEKNYDVAWSLLVQRYDNKRILVDAQLKALTSQPDIKRESAQAIKQILDTTNECIHALKNLDVDVSDTLVTFLIIQKLPIETRELWERSLEDSREFPPLKKLVSFLESRFHRLEVLKGCDGNRLSQLDSANKTKRDIHSLHIKHYSSCPICNKNHTLRQCHQFLKMNVTDRKELLMKRSICQNCLATSHLTAGCSSPRSCYYCGQRHHSLIHNDVHSSVATSSKAYQNPSTSSQGNFDKGITSLYIDRQRSSNILLATALIRVSTLTGDHTLRVLIDPGSPGSFIREDIAQKLQLKKHRVTARIKGLGSNLNSIANSEVSFDFHSLHDTSFSYNVNAFVLSSLTDVLPSHNTYFPDTWYHLKNIALADPTLHIPGKIDVLLGMDVYANILLEGIRRGPSHTPIAQNTYLGWIVFGDTSCTEKQPTTSSLSVVSCHSLVEIEGILKRFWELEEIPQEKVLLREDQECEEFYSANHHRNEDGSYEVYLPFVNFEPPVLGASKNTALLRMNQLERKLERNPEIKQLYIDCLEEYLLLGHMKPVTTSEEDHVKILSDIEKGFMTNYLPHHAVLKESTTTRLRVVFDASHHTSNGHSLNDTLLVGPKLQEDLISIVLRWRKHKIAFTADITKMYRMIRVAAEHIPYQRILWRKSTSEPIQEYELTTVTFGTACAQYLAIRTLRQLAEDEKQRYPLAYPVVMQDLYVDDVMSGAENIDEALEIQKQLSDMLLSGGFELRKWASNNAKLMESIPKEKREIKIPLDSNENNSVKTLGLYWWPSSDVFTIKVHINSNPSTPTKRILLSEIASLFDPSGWFAPTIIDAKILMQSLWLKGICWDDPVPSDIAQRWNKIKQELHLLERVKIPRWIGTSQPSSSLQLHGFCDASTAAYCAVVYVRIQDNNGNVKVSLLTAKSKVAPVKPVTLPRLELCAALLVAKLLQHTQRSMNLNYADTYAWSDSKIALAWIHGQPSKWKTFVCNRVAAIQDLIACSCWRYVSTKENPADYGSRGLLPSSLVENNLWWLGPPWLHTPTKHWPNNTTETQTTAICEVRNVKVHCIQLPCQSELLAKFSSLHKLLRVTAFCFRFVRNCKSTRMNRKSGYLSSDELHYARTYWIKAVQWAEFQQDITDIKNHRPLSSKGRLLCLNPFIGNDGLLRVGGRLPNATLTFSEKHPIILPSKHYLTTLIITAAHHATLHGGPQLIASYLRKSYWIINARSTIRYIVHRCLTCFKYELMGNLPKPRLKMSRPFSHTGVDYAGPISIRFSKGRGIRSYKGYIGIFICLCTKAIHLEANEHQQAIHAGTKTTAEIFAIQGINWHFIPPATPHFGGLWEAGVKSMKHHLRRILGETTLTYEELSTVLCQIEACLNSRPLCPISSDAEDLAVLTPGHFLMGTAPLTPPEPNMLNLNMNVLSRWQLLQQLYQQFWKRWISEYLPRLQKRPKWSSQKRNIGKGDIVLIKQEKCPPMQWPLGRIIETFPGKDGLVRVVMVKTKSGTIKRPITKFCLLPIVDNHDISA